MIKNIKGMSLVEVMVVIGILSIVIAGTAGIMTQMLKGQKIVELRFSAQNISDSIRSYVTNSEAWRQMVEGTCLTDSASEFECKTSLDADGKPIATQLPSIKDAGGNVKYSLGGANGFKVSGEACTSFPSSDCPIAVQVSWAPDTDLGGCEISECKRPSVYVEAQFSYDGKSPFGPFNIARYNFRVNKPGVVMTVADSCAAIGGTFDAASKQCDLPNDVQNSCVATGGTWDDIDKTCQLPSQVASVCTAMGGTFDAATKQCVLPTGGKDNCEAIGGTYNSGTSTCQLPSQVADACSAMGGTYNARTGRCSLKDTIDKAIKRTCNSLGGVFDAGSGKCTLTNPDPGACLAGEIVTGIDASGAKICSSINSVLAKCEKGEYLEGYRRDGSPICKSVTALLSGPGGPLEPLPPGAGPYPSYLNGKTITVSNAAKHVFNGKVENGWPYYKVCSNLPSLYSSLCPGGTWTKGEYGSATISGNVPRIPQYTISLSLYGLKVGQCSDASFDDGGIAQPCNSYKYIRKSWMD